MAKRPHLLACSNDVLFLILELCDRRSIQNLSLTSKSMRLQCIPHLYRTVDLSSHNAGRISEQENDAFPEMWACEFDKSAPVNHISRQRSFLRIMAQHPEYAIYVRTFFWTLTWGEPNEYKLTEVDYQLWAIFSRLERVEKLDLAAITSPDKVWEEEEPYTVQIPPVLFPRVTDLRLMGWMPHKLVRNIFNSIDISSLRFLSLDALQERGHFPDGSPISEDFNKESWSSEWRAKLGASVRDTRIIFPGPAWIPILPLIDNLSSLQRLEIRIPPLEECREYGGDCPEYSHYISVMAQLLASFQPTLKELVIDSARGRRGPSSPKVQMCGTSRILNRRVQSDRLRRGAEILRSLFPILDEWNWKQIRSISVKGFLDDNGGGNNQNEIHVLENVRDKLENYFLGRGVRFEWENDSPRPAHLFMGQDFRVEEATMDERWKILLEDYGVQLEVRE